MKLVTYKTFDFKNYVTLNDRLSEQKIDCNNTIKYKVYYNLW